MFISCKVCWTKYYYLGSSSLTTSRAAILRDSPFNVWSRLHGRRAGKSLRQNYVAFFVGAFITMLVQSSTAITAQFMSLKLTCIALPVAAIGFFIMIFSKKENIRHVGQAIMGFGLMFLGLKILNSGLRKLNCIGKPPEKGPPKRMIRRAFSLFWMFVLNLHI